jgi:hypothetical protein
MMHPAIMYVLAKERLAELKREVTHAVEQDAASPLENVDVSLRLCRVSDDEALDRLAAVAERELPPGRLAVVEVDGRIVAAQPLAGGRPIADPFVRTAHLLPLLELRAAQIRGAGDRRVRRAPRVLPHRA